MIQACPLLCDFKLSNCVFSENESTTGKVDEKKRKTRPKRRKTLERSPRLTVLSYDEEEGELECRLELYNKNTVTFKFATAYDKPEEIAESLVSKGFSEPLCMLTL